MHSAPQMRRLNNRLKKECGRHFYLRARPVAAASITGRVKTDAVAPPATFLQIVDYQAGNGQGAARLIRAAGNSNLALAVP